MTLLHNIIQAGILALVVSTSSFSQDDGTSRNHVPKPLGETGAVPNMASQQGVPSSGAAGDRQRSRRWRGEIEELRGRHFGLRGRNQLRAEGLAKIRLITDHAAFQPMFEVLQGEDDDVLVTMLDHFAAQGDAGQAALAWIAIHGGSSALRYEATLRMTRPACHSVLVILDQELRDTRHAVVSNAAMLANALDVFEAIPLLIFNQVTHDPYVEGTDRSFIASGTQISYVQNIVPVVGRGGVIQKPIVGVVGSGTVLEIGDGIATNYRHDVHESLVSLSTRDWGRSTGFLGWDMRGWWSWYNDDYVPFKREQSRLNRQSSGLDELLRELREPGVPRSD